jgi:hypothetical protein
MNYALSKEKDTAELLKGKKVSPLSPKETEVYSYIRDRYNDLLDQLNEARAIVGKPPINKVENYITHIANLSVLEQMGFSPILDDIETLLANKVHRNATAFQWAKKRTGGLQDVERDALNVFRKYQEKALDHIHLTPAIAKVRELSRSMIPDGADKFKLQDYKPGAFKYISEWTDFVAGQKVQNNIPPVIDNYLQKLNQNIAFSTLSYNAQSAVIQPSAIGAAVTEIGPKNVAVGLKALMRGEREFALEHSNVLEGRQFDTAIQDMANNIFGKGARIRRKVAEVGIKPLQVLDSITAQATWLGAYNRAVSELGLVGEKAYNFADDVVVKTQASAARSDVAKVQRSTGGKLLTQFQTFVINDFNRINRDVLGIGNDKMSKTDVIKKAATALIFASGWNYVSEDVLGIPSPFPRPVKTFKEKGAVEAARELSSQIPVVGGSLRYGSSLTGATLGLILDAEDKVNGKYTSKTWWEIAGKVLGVPGATQAKKIIQGIQGNTDGFTFTTNSGKRVKVKITDPIDKIRAILFGPHGTKKADDTKKNSKKTGKIVL